MWFNNITSTANFCVLSSSRTDQEMGLAHYATFAAENHQWCNPPWFHLWNSFFMLDLWSDIQGSHHRLQQTAEDCSRIILHMKHRGDISMSMFTEKLFVGHYRMCTYQQYLVVLNKMENKAKMLSYMIYLITNDYRGYYTCFTCILQQWNDLQV